MLSFAYSAACASVNRSFMWIMEIHVDYPCQAYEFFGE